MAIAVEVSALGTATRAVRFGSLKNIRTITRI